MTKLLNNIQYVSTAIMSVVLSILPAGAENLASGHQVSNVTNYGDGMQIMDYADKSGFEVVGPGGRFVFDSHTKVMTFTADSVSVKFLADGRLDPQSADAFNQVIGEQFARVNK
ncbi:MAG TPA: hypothetical protein V6C97_17985 [Oculatellaceae cyanobacterium]